MPSRPGQRAGSAASASTSAAEASPTEHSGNSTWASAETQSITLKEILRISPGFRKSLRKVTIGLLRRA